jgi:hypothetical protein
MKAWSETNSRHGRYRLQEKQTMMIFMLAAAMTVAMLIATVFGMHQEAQRLKYEPKRIDRFGHRRF